MLTPATPANEQSRLAALRALKLLDTSSEERFDRITRLAQRLFGVPIAVVSLVDAERQWFKSIQGLAATETPRDVSFCGHAILQEDVFHVPNALEDLRFHDNPLVTGAPDIRFYAGAPLATDDGHRVGTLCIIDRAPRSLPPEDQRVLRDLADLVQEEFSRLELGKAVSLIRDQESRLRAVLDTVVDGIITIDAHGTVQTFNPAATRIFGYEPCDVIGRNVSMLMPQPYRSEHDGYIRRFFSSRTPRVIGIGREVEGLRKDGSTFPMELSVSEMELDGQRSFTGIVRDITLRRNSERELRETTALQEAILDGARYSIIATDVHGTIVKFNRAAELMLGYCAEEVLGKLTPAPFHDAEELARYAAQLSEELGEHVEPGFETLIAKARRHTHDEHEWTYRRKDGSTVPVLQSVTALRDATDKITGFLGMSHDISERRKIDQMKNEFVSTVSHELRTPLTSIRGSLGLVCGGVAGQLPPQAKELVEIAHKNSERLVRLINDILDIEKIESGKMRIELVTQPALPVVQQALAANQGFAAHHKVTLAFASKADDAKIRVDSDRLIQVLTNLVSNAVKFSPAQGTVTVALQRRSGMVRLTVADQGPGIPDEFRERIFQKFAQADSSDQRQKGGTGLGLAITRSLVESMGGQVGFDSSTSGSTFWADLPEVDVASAPRRRATDRNADGPRVLICEDDPDVANLIRIVLQNAGYRPDIAHDATEALSMLAESDYGAMTVDIMLPGKDGISFIRELRAGTVGRDLPIVVVSATEKLGREPQLGGIAVVDWLAKPIDHSRLLAAVRSGVAQSAPARPRILHVDDDRDIHRVVEAIAGTIGDFDHAYDLSSAVALLEKNSYSLVVLDLTLPDGCGRDLLERITTRRPAPKVVVFSASDVNGDAASHFAACLLKSTTTNDTLLEVLRAQIAPQADLLEMQA